MSPPRRVRGVRCVQYRPRPRSKPAAAAKIQRESKEADVAKFDLIAFDLDGTVFPEPSAKSIRPRVVAALQAAHDAGVITAVASGRTVGMLGPTLTGAPWVDWLITVNGACVSSARDGRVLSDYDNALIVTGMVVNVNEAYDVLNQYTGDDDGRVGRSTNELMTTTVEFLLQSISYVGNNNYRKQLPINY